MIWWVFMSDDYEKYHRLAYKVAAPFLTGFPKLYEDLKGAAMLGLCEGLNKAKIKNHPNPGALVVFHVKWELIKCLQTSYCIIRLPRWFIEKEKILAYEREEPFSIAKLYPQIWQIVEWEIDARIFYNEEAWRNLKQQIADVHLTKLEEEVLIFRLSDYTYMEIAKELGYSDAGIIRIMERIRKKWSKQKT
jgi:RNA polymerase sigma factor (sigma-70 family)